MNPVRVRRHNVTFRPESERVIIRPFIPGRPQIVLSILKRALALSEAEAGTQLQGILAEFASRHFDIESLLLAHSEKVRPHIAQQPPLSRVRQLLIGAMFSGEYALESAALFNPSIVPHPDQSGVPEGGMRFIMSLRATGEGHISSIEFRTGLISPDGVISVEPVSRFVTVPEIVPNPTYKKKRFITKLQEMGFEDGPAAGGDDLACGSLEVADDFFFEISKGRLPILAEDLRDALPGFLFDEFVGVDELVADLLGK